MFLSLISLFFTFSYVRHVQALPQLLQDIFSPWSPVRSNSSHLLLYKRQAPPPQTICGYLTGDSRKIRSAAPGFGCRVDTRNGIWGFCPTTVIVASDCGLFGVCYDNNLCQDGCGKTDISGLTSTSCTNSDGLFCSIAVISPGPDQEYSNVACGRSPIREVYFPQPTTTPLPSTTPQRTSTSASPAPTPSLQLAPTTSSSRSSATSPEQVPTSSTSKSVVSSTVPSTTTSISSFGSTSASPEATSSTSPAPNLGPIIGGSIGGLALICFTVLGVFYIRKRRRDRDEASPTSLRTVPPDYRDYRTTEMQTGGLHEKDDGPRVYEADGTKKQTIDSWRDSRRSRYEMAG